MDKRSNSMSLIIDAIYENGVLRPLGSLDLAEHQQVRVIVEATAPGETASRPVSDEDPLAGIRINTGLGDLAEHFDDYRFGRRSP
jgi:predicted DNA-binding antitoxin AbrB/MazE fold protein